MAQFHQAFFEESFERLDVMESGLLHMDPGVVNGEDINAIFRAADSIKGGSGTFGFSGVADFTHVMETLLDEMRGARPGTRQPGGRRRQRRRMGGALELVVQPAVLSQSPGVHPSSAGGTRHPSDPVPPPTALHDCDSQRH